MCVVCVQVCLCTSTVPGLGYGICAAQRIPQGTWIGPFQGVPLLLDKLQSGAARNTRHLWEVREAVCRGCAALHLYCRCCSIKKVCQFPFEPMFKSQMPQTLLLFILLPDVSLLWCVADFILHLCSLCFCVSIIRVCGLCMCVCQAVQFVVSVMSPLSPLIRADCIYIQWQEKVNVAVINSCISISEGGGGAVRDAGRHRDRWVPQGRAGKGQSDVGWPDISLPAVDRSGTPGEGEGATRVGWGGVCWACKGSEVRSRGGWGM